jgi:Tfp pilus assembly protein PilF
MKKISTHTFKHTLKDIHKNTESRKFCFIIGAGASSKSGIPTGGELAEKWFLEIKERSDKAELEAWISDNKINEKALSASYGIIYRKRFQADKTSGYEFLVQAMKTAKPSFGHIVLSQILSRTRGHCVLTTNFDSLIESSVYQFTNKTPLVCGHESLSGYARPSQIHPLIIKIHRDLLLDPKSDPNEIDCLDPKWKEPLDNIFSSHIPIIIGYGGNDGSLMSYFETMNRPSNFFWCTTNPNNRSQRVQKLIKKHEGNVVQIDGFDELMHELLWVFDEIKPIKEVLKDITEDRSKIATKQQEEIINKSNAKTIDLELSALEYSNLADKELNLEKRKKIYEEAIAKYPTTGWLWWNYTYFLNFVKKDYEDLNNKYIQALKYNENEAGLLGNYAIYLDRVKNDYTKADEYFTKSLLLDPENVAVNAEYADFLKFIMNDMEKAKIYYLKTLAIDPENASALGGYAQYLYRKKQYDNAAEYYTKALKFDPENSANHANYANYLKNITKEYDKAEIHFLKAIHLNPEDVAVKTNYAQFLLINQRKEEAEVYIDESFNVINDKEYDVTLELWFYRYAHYPKHYGEAEKKVEALLSKGIRSLGWNLNENIKIAEKENHPNRSKLKEFANRITQK